MTLDAQGNRWLERCANGCPVFRSIDNVGPVLCQADTGRNVSTTYLETADCTLLFNRNVRELIRMKHSP